MPEVERVHHQTHQSDQYDWMVREILTEVTARYPRLLKVVLQVDPERKDSDTSKKIEPHLYNLTLPKIAHAIGTINSQGSSIVKCLFKCFDMKAQNIPYIKINIAQA